MVTIWDNRGIQFSGCTFKNQSPTVIDKKYGLYTIDASYDVVDNCTFDGFTSGTYSTNSSSTNYPYIRNSTFSNNALGIYAGSVNNVSATISTFNVGQYRTSSYNHGVYLNNSTGYEVDGNNFTGYSPTLAPAPVGVLCLNTGDANNQIKSNRYTNFYIANYAFGDNRNNSTPSNGLKYFCNTNTNNANYDFAVVIDDNLNEDDSGIATPQGSAGAAAGNKFSLRTTPIGSDFYNGTIHSIQYYYRNATSENPGNLSGVTKTLTSNSPGCTAPMFAGGGGDGGSLSASELASLQNEYTTQKAKYDTELQTRTSKIDNGNTENLLLEVDKVIRGNSSALEEKLIGISPWLSAEVLKKILDKKDAFSATFVSKILAANPEALYSPTLQRKMQEVLTTEQVNAARTAQSNSTERSALESRLADAGTITSRNANAIVRHYLVTEPVDLKKVREWLYNKNELESHYQIVESWLQEQNTKEAEKVLNTIDTQFKLTDRQQKAYEDYKQITDLKIKAMNEGRTIADFKEVEVLELVTLADRNLGRAGEQAKGILNFFYGYQYVNPQLPLPGEEVEQRTESTLPETEVAALQSNALIQVVPNPASSEVTFKYNLEGQEMEEGALQVIDFTGRLVQRFELTQNVGEIRWTMNGLQNGVYFYSLRNKGRIITFGRLVVAK